MKKTLSLLGFGAGLASALFMLSFRGPRSRFWDRMTATGLSLGTLALVAQPGLRKTRVTLKDVLLGILSAAGLYGIFHIGDRLSRRIVPNGGEQIEEIYKLKRIRPRQELMVRFGPFWGTLMGVAAYGGVHISSGNFTLVGAATVAGAFWGGLYMMGMPLGALIISHILWDNLIFIIAPTTKLAGEA